DHHCHGIVAEPMDRSSFAGLLSEGGAAMHAEIDPADTPLGLAVRSLCAPVLDLDPHVPFDVYLARRNELPDVNERFLNESSLSHLLVDTGYQQATLLDPDQIAELGPFQTDEIVRIETVAEETFASFGADDFVDAFALNLRRRAENAVGLKSIVAYRAGFDLDPRRPIALDVRRALAGWRFGQRLDDRVLLRHCLHVAIELAADEQLPLQLHTGFGDSDIDLWRSDPTRFSPWLRAAPAEARFCFLHCWPYHREAAFLAAVFPSVYFDTGEVNTHGALSYRSILAEAMEIAPFGKLLYSSDAFALSELYYIASQEFRDALGSILHGWLRNGRCATADAARIVHMVSVGNARRLYQLPEPMASTEQQSIIASGDGFSHEAS
ncbi:MAG: amidohydrolase family protein, partial [Actinomycetota bacterium]